MRGGARLLPGSRPAEPTRWHCARAGAIVAQPGSQRQRPVPPVMQTMSGSIHQRAKGALRACYSEAQHLVSWPVQTMPGAFASRVLRPAFWRTRLRHLGKGVSIEEGVLIENPSYVTIGDGCWLARGAVIRAGPVQPRPGGRMVRGPSRPVADGVVEIGNGVHIMEYATVGGKGGLVLGNNAAIGSRASLYTYTQVSFEPDVLFVNGTTIGDNVMIGTNATVLCVGAIPANASVRPNTCVSEVMSRKPVFPPKGPDKV